MNDKKTSSIDWFVEQIHKNLPTYDLLNFDQKLFFNELVKQAKAMHKEEIMDAFQHGKWDWYEHLQQGILSKDTAEYYNETFGGQDETNSI